MHTPENNPQLSPVAERISSLAHSTYTTALSELLQPSYDQTPAYIDKTVGSFALTILKQYPEPESHLSTEQLYIEPKPGDNSEFIILADETDIDAALAYSEVNVRYTAVHHNGREDDFRLEETPSEYLDPIAKLAYESLVYVRENNPRPTVDNGLFSHDFSLRHQPTTPLNGMEGKSWLENHHHYMRGLSYVLTAKVNNAMKSIPLDKQKITILTQKTKEATDASNQARNFAALYRPPGHSR